ncbi:DNA gyrase inhibitor [Paenibacillus sp. LMG 31459]|uniref:DNA gyrase inhibitor n=1 Tax=Paenibacillus phytohabitans TaxID=2654978 RepID=A0ABX1YAD5_9BACL|nr:GyrI-like domain-containing protein [Paenibacillus phytohabitans]NOU77842.1 DNA gyrase inhibitor [Paenibacillus phytohabitans]
MKIQLETFPVTRIAYVRQTGPYGPGNSKAMEALKEWAQAHRLLTGSAILFGIPQDNPDTTLPEHCRYDACISVPENAQADKSINYGEIPGGTYAIVTIQHTAEAVQKAWTEILPSLYGSGHLLDYQRPVMERYTGDMISNHLCQLCFPVH